MCAHGVKLIGGATAWHPRISDVGFHAIFRVHQWILFPYWRSWSSFSSPSLMKNPKVECLVLKVPHQDEDFQDFLLVFKPMNPMNPFNSCLCEVSCFFWCFHLRLLSVIAFWIWCSAWNLGIAIRAIRDRKWRQAKPSSFGPFPQGLLSSRQATLRHVARHGKSVRPWEIAHRNIARKQQKHQITSFFWGVTSWNNLKKKNWTPARGEYSSPRIIWIQKLILRGQT